MLKWLLTNLLVLVIFIPVAALLPLAAVALSRDPDGAQFLFWAGPWSCCLWTLIYSQLSASKSWLGVERVRRSREASGGLLHTSILACGWMLGSLLASYCAEFLLLVSARHPATWLPAATYSPLAFCWLWRKARA